MIRSARALIGWSQADLAKAAQLGERTVKRVERAAHAERGPRADATDRAIRDAFLQAGVVFMPAGADVDGKIVVAGVVQVRAGDEPDQTT